MNRRDLWRHALSDYLSALYGVQDAQYHVCERPFALVHPGGVIDVSEGDTIYFDDAAQEAVIIQCGEALRCHAKRPQEPAAGPLDCPWMRGQLRSAEIAMASPRHQVKLAEITQLIARRSVPMPSEELQ